MCFLCWLYCFYISLAEITHTLPLWLLNQATTESLLSVHEASWSIKICSKIHWWISCLLSSTALTQAGRRMKYISLRSLHSCDMSSFENKLCTCEDTVGWKVGQEEGKNLLIVPPVLPVVLHRMAGWTHFWWRPLDLWEVGVFTQSTCRDKEVGFLYWATKFGSLWSWEKIKNMATQGGKRMNCDH